MAAATRVPCLIIRCFCIISLAYLILKVPAAKYCNYGFDVSSPDSLKNQSCTTEEIHLLSTFFATDQSREPTFQDAIVHFYDEHSQREIMHKTSHPCFIFRHLVTQMIKPDIKQESVHIVFGCDFKNLCEHKGLNKVLYGEMVNKSRGQLFCCDSENCNIVDRLPHLPAENRVCYHGISNRSEAQTNKSESGPFSKGAKESCSHPDAMCAKMSVYLPHGITESYFCDNDMFCRDQMLSGSFRSCHAKVVNNTTQELCCCDTSMCFEPQWPDPTTTHKIANNSVPDFIDTEVNDIPVVTKDGIVITGLVVALFFVTGVGGGIIIVMACKKRRYPGQDPNVIMQYERLSASDPDGTVVL